MTLLVRGGSLPGGRPVDIRIAHGTIVEMGPDLDPHGTCIDARGAYLIPGLWDAHVHFGQWARSTTWFDISAAPGPVDVCAAVARALPDIADSRLAIGFGHRSANWDTSPTVAMLDAVSGDRPVVLISGDAHNGWLNSAALNLMGLAPRDGLITEGEWFPVLSRIAALPGARPTTGEESRAVSSLAASGLVGIVDLEFSDTLTDWPARVAAGIDSLRVRAGVYSHQLDDAIVRGLHSGDPLPGGRGLLEMGPLKIISDGSLSTHTAWCDAPYLGSTSHGAPNVSQSELHALMRRATDNGLTLAVHAIGDRAASVVLDAFAATKARGSLEHAQLLRTEDVPRFHQLGVTASVQPAHLIDDRDLTQRVWGDRSQRSFLARSLLDAGAHVTLGSDAPVSPPDPWLAMATAVWRSGDERPGWHQEQALTPAEALSASVDGQRLRVGARGDVVVLESDPLAPMPAQEAARALREMRIRATICDGRITHGESDD